MLTAILLTVLGTLARLAPHPPNAVAMGALALYAGARLPRRWAFLVPMAAMAASDVWIDWGSGRSVLAIDRITGYATFALIVASGRWLRSTTSPMARMGMSVAASTAFFLTSNFVVWASPQVGHPTFPATMDGLLQCYAFALPFFRKTLVADLIGTAVLFGLDGLAYRVTSRWKPASAALAVE
ncbi:MAG: hypothetical protein JWN86_4669 [Planctomycetota bacterium]|nr:hypothetical protein [Planctomycetota bacterium]